MFENEDHKKGLTDEEVIASRQAHGSNALEGPEGFVFLSVVREVVLEPMFILLLSACILYFVLGSYQEGVIMLISIQLVAGISLFQEYRSRKSVNALRKLSAPGVSVIRNGVATQIPTDDMVVGDIMLLEEGQQVPADGRITSSNDFSLNESMLTGESLTIYKSATDNPMVYRGTLVSSGSASALVTAVGKRTMLGKIGTSMTEIANVRTPLQLQIRSFVRNMVWFGVVAFCLVVFFHYRQSGQLLHSIMHGLTLAMSVLPEEIPVAFSVFQALGAFRLLSHQIIVKQPRYVETLGSATVICADKTGTLTENNMSIAFLFPAASMEPVEVSKAGADSQELIEYAMWASESSPFDPMEKSIHALYEANCGKDKRPLFTQVHEYPISGKPPMMTHVFRNGSGTEVIAAKGAPEAIWDKSNVTETNKRQLVSVAHGFAEKGYRVIGVGKSHRENGDWPLAQEDFRFEFLGLIAFYDPPKAGIGESIRAFHDAGISVKMITGDYPETAMAIARQIGLNADAACLTGNEILQMSPDELRAKVSRVSLYARMFPEAKLRVIDALKDNGEVVAMTGDGVNDGPALKAAHIGIAMGERGSEVAKEAASLILSDDNLAHMVDAVALGRKIYDNLSKAIRYIVSIHIPIIGIVTLPLLLGWDFVDVFTPVHVIFLELIMGPTCSIVYENEPMEPGTMKRMPRKPSSTFLSSGQLAISIIQGLFITSSCLLAGYLLPGPAATEEEVRTVIFVTLLFSNMMLTLINRSFVHSLFTSLHYRNKLIMPVLTVTLLFMMLILYVAPVSALFGIRAPGILTLGQCLLFAMAGTGWMEIWKWTLRRKSVNRVI